MALVDLRYSSPPIEKMASLIAIIPENAPRDADGRLPTVYQLHGLSDDHTVWQRRTRIEQLAEKHGVMVVLLDGARAYYINSLLGRYEDHTVDAIRVCENLFPAARDPRRRGIGGLSMGGYGSMKIGLKYPHVYASVAAHSAAMDIARLVEVRYSADLHVVAPSFDPAADHIFALVEKAAQNRTVLPSLRFDCGVDDFLLEDNRTLHRLLDKHGLPHVYEEFPGGHSWDYWDAHLDAALAHHVASFARAMEPVKTAPAKKVAGGAKRPATKHSAQKRGANA